MWDKIIMTKKNFFKKRKGLEDKYGEYKIEKLNDVLKFKNYKLSSLEYSYKASGNLTVFITIFLSIVTTYNVIFSKDDVGSSTWWVDMVSKSFNVLLILSGTILIAVLWIGEEIALTESEIDIIKNEIELRRNVSEKEIILDIDETDKKEIIQESYIENELDKIIFLNKGKLSKEEKLKRLGVLKVEADNISQNRTVVDTGDFKFLSTIIVSVVALLISAFGIAISAIDNNILSVAYTSAIAIYIVIILVLYFIEYRKHNKNLKENNIKINNEKQKLKEMNIEIQVLKYLLYIEDNITIEV